MRKSVLLICFLFFCMLYTANAQVSPTRIVRFEIDGKQIKKAYDVFFSVNKGWVKSKKTADGFKIPDELKNEIFFDISISFGKYQLEFSRIHISKFRADWIVGIDTKPFSDDNVDPEDIDKTEMASFIDFLGTGTRVVLLKTKP